jgi:hypothetical protein
VCGAETGAVHKQKLLERRFVPPTLFWLDILQFITQYFYPQNATSFEAEKKMKALWEMVFSLLLYTDFF